MANDIKLKSLDGDLTITNGDFVIADSEYQHIHDILYDGSGEWKAFPTLGLGLKFSQFGPADTLALKQNIKFQLSQDGYSSDPNVYYDYSTSKLKIFPNATR